jgi:pimeloyl-ACP methyl ester carboxylesterase
MAVTLYARDVGQGPALVLLHAFPLSSAMWLAQREGLAGRFRIVTPDLRGFGGSVLGTDEPSIDHMADDVDQLLRTLGIQRAVIGGLSLGGYVAMALCRRHPERVLALVLANTKATADTDEARANRHAMAEQLEGEGTVAPLLDQILPNLVGPTTLRQRALVYGRVRGLVQATPPRAAAWAQRAMAARPESFDTLRETRAPALVIAGGEDALASEDDARAVADALPNAELLVLPHSGHLSAVEQPDVFNQAVAEFVTAVAKTSA